MDQQIDLKQIERKVWTSFFEDGIWDIYLGLLLMAMAIAALLWDIGTRSEVTLFVIYVCLVGAAFGFFWFGKRFITIPRIGRVHFGPKGRARKKKTSIVFALSVLVGLVLFIIITINIKDTLSRVLSLNIFVPAVWVANMLVVFSLAAYFLHFNRLYLIGVMFAIGFPLDIVLKELLHRNLTFFAFGVPAMVVLIMGGVVLVRFLRKYSKSTEEAI